MKFIRRSYIGQRKASLKRHLDALVLLTRHGKLIHRQFKKQNSILPRQARYGQRLSMSLIALTIIALFINIILPATTARAEATLSWSNNADFAFNKASKCQPTNIDKLVISGSEYTDATCAALAADSDLTLSPNNSDLQDIKTVGYGDNFSVALKNDGTVWSWGTNNYGQLGNATYTLSTLPIQVKDAAGTGYLTGITAVSVGASHVLALDGNGNVWAWGYNNSGRLGDGGATNRNLPVQVLDVAGAVYISGVSAISAGGNHSTALKSDGTVYAWGNGQYGQIGDNGAGASRYRPVQVKDIAGTGYLSGIGEIANGYYQSFAIGNDGTVFAWGMNTSGQLGDSSAINRFYPVRVKNADGTGLLGGVTELAASGYHTLALRDDGTVWAWGNSNNGALGDNSGATQYRPVQVKDTAGTGYLSGIQSVGVGSSHSIAVKDDGTVWAWGYNYNGQLGDGTTTGRPLPVQSINTGGETINNGSSVGRSVSSSSSLVITVGRTLLGWGNNQYGLLGHKMYGSATVKQALSIVSSVDTEDFSGIRSVANGAYHFLALDQDGTVWSWGNNDAGQLGDGTTTTRLSAAKVMNQDNSAPLSGIISVAASSSFSLALSEDGTVWSWGYNGYGQLGNNTNTWRSLPAKVKDAAGTGVLSGVSAITIGSSANFALALKQDGTVWAWGYNQYSGALGDGTTGNRWLPVQVKDQAGSGYLGGITSVAAGNNYSIALGEDGTVWSWGTNNYGQLGDGTTTARYLPAQVKGPGGVGLLSGVDDIDSGNYFALAKKSDGTLWGWGNNQYGQLGSTGTGLSPLQVKDAAGTGYLLGAVQISAGASSAYAVMPDGIVWAWGLNNYGQLAQNTPNTVGMVKVINPIASGYLGGITNVYGEGNTAVALTTEGSLYAWGGNSNGWLGTGSYLERTLLPQTVYRKLNYLTGYSQSGSLDGIVFDLGAGKKTRWYGVSWNTDALPAGTSAKFNVRTSSDGSSWSSWSQDFSQTTTGSTTGTADIDSLPLSRYIELKATLATTDNNVTPKLNDFSLAYMEDVSAPDTNAANIKLSRVQNGTPISQDGWIDIQTPYITWDDATDDINGSGIQGYCLYLGTDATADFSQTKGILGNSPLDTGGKCQYAVTTNHIDLSLPGVLASDLEIANNPYRLLVKSIDNGANVYDGAAAGFTFNYDNTPPTNPVFVSAPSQFVSDKNVTLTWPATGDQSANDADSQIAGLQYRIGSEGTWYGDTHNGQQDLTDVLANDGTYQMDQVVDYPLLHEGNNVVYFRTLDRAGNISTSYITSIVKLNTSSPSSPLNVTATPASNNTNSFAFSWHAPASFVGVASGMTYCYTVNALPTANNCTYTNPGQISLAADAYATQPGENIFYVVARDEASNINYATYGSATFTANTPAPGLPQNIEIADISSKDAQLWKLAFSWAAPTNVGAGIAKYAVFRSTDGTNFAQTATTSGLSYVDSSLSQVTYYYKVKACDSANNCGAFSDVVSKLPTGRFTTPPELISNVGVEVSTRKASFSWVTDRISDSRVQYGVSSGDYFAGEVAVSAQLKTHSVDMDNLTAGTTYYYRVKWTDEDGNTGVSSEYTFSTLPAPVIKNVEIIKKTLSSATIKITTMDATKVSLFYGKSENFGGVTSVNTSRSESSYIVELTGLDDGSDYFFKLITFDADGNQYDSHRIDAFSTPPRPRISNLRFQPVNGEPTSTQSVVWTTNIPANSTVTYGKVGTNGSDVYLSKVSTEHEIILRGLEDDSQYFLMAQSRDADGNLAVSDRQTFKTALDTRAPKISDIRIETAVKGNGSEARGQIVVSWKTDEPATSQVAYAYGSAGSELPNKTGEDAQLSMDHVVIVSDLTVSKVYHLVPISRDKSQNASLGEDRSAVVGRATESVLNIILNSLKGIFGL